MRVSRGDEGRMCSILLMSHVTVTGGKLLCVCEENCIVILTSIIHQLGLLMFSWKINARINLSFIFSLYALVE